MFLVAINAENDIYCVKDGGWMIPETIEKGSGFVTNFVCENCSARFAVLGKGKTLVVNVEVVGTIYEIGFSRRDALLLEEENTLSEQDLESARKLSWAPLSGRIVEFLCANQNKPVDPRDFGVKHVKHVVTTISREFQRHLLPFEATLTEKGKISLKRKPA